MAIQLTPDDEKLIQERLQAGTFRSVEEVIHDALASQAAEAKWLAENKAAVDAEISRGVGQLDRGEGVVGGEARARLKQRKAAWRRDPQSR